MQTYDLTDLERLLYTTTRISTTFNGASLQVGTGFFYRFAWEGTSYCYLLITNKHVLRGADSVTFNLHLGGSKQKGPSGDLHQVVLELSDNVFVHPDPEVDLCGVLLSPLLVDFEGFGINPFIVCIETGSVARGPDWEGFDGVEEILMNGCPSGIYDSKNNLPITRRGITATPLRNDYEGRREFVIDMACFPGSSGSPIFVADTLGHLDRASNSYNFGQSRIKLVGILFAGPLVDAKGEVTLANPGQVSVQTMMHLGYALKADRLIDLEQEVRRIAT